MIFTFFIALMLTSCRHSPEVYTVDTTGNSFCTFPVGDTLCNDDWVPPLDPTNYGPHMYDGIHYMCPSVNPNNPNQFVCFKTNTLFPPKTEIMVYDMQTGLERTLFTNSIVTTGNLSWGKKNWIAYTSGQGIIRIFKSDGNNDRQIAANSGMNFATGMGPEWSPDGNFLYYHSSFGSPNKAMYYDTIGESVSVAPFMIRPDWNQNNKFIGGGGQVIKVADLSHTSGTIIAQWSKQNVLDEIVSIEWLPDNRHAVFSKTYGLYRVDTQTGEILPLKDWCDMKNYSMLSVSDEGKFILCQKKINKKPNKSTLIYYNEIWKMDVNGCNEVRVLPK